MDQSLQPEEIKKIVLKKALDLLSQREHSLHELRHKLLSREFEAQIVEEALSHIAEKGWQSDERFAESYVNMRIQRFYGPVKIRQELLERGVSKELIEDQLSLDEDEWVGLALMVRKKHFGEAMPETFKAKTKQMRFLQYRGFTTDQINRVF